VKISALIKRPVTSIQVAILQNFPVSKLHVIAKAHCLVRAGMGRAGFRFITQSKTSVPTLCSRCFKIKYVLIFKVTVL
jgi:hypothetical protein